MTYIHINHKANVLPHPPLEALLRTTPPGVVQTLDAERGTSDAKLFCPLLSWHASRIVKYSTGLLATIPVAIQPYTINYTH